MRTDVVLAHPTCILRGIFCLCACLPMAVQAANSPEPGEMQARDAWIKERLLDFRRQPSPKTPESPAGRLVVVANHDPVLQNTRGGRPLTLGKTPYARGLYCHAVSRVIVRLPAPGKTFRAVVGVDSNPQTSGGRGSVVFSVTVQNKTAFKTDVMHENTPARSVNVDLAGVTTFTLEVGDAGDGISCDQADWADARVALADGRELWLGDLPLSDQPAPVRTGNLPFSFVYDGRPADDILATSARTVSVAPLDDARTQRTIVWNDAKTGLAVRCVAVEYRDWPVVEWTVYWKNTGCRNTPILEQLEGLDVRLDRPAGDEFLLRHYRGDTSGPNLYEPLEQSLAPGSTLRLAPNGGRGTNGAFPYYNLAMPHAGLIVAVGWPGQWAATFHRDADRGLRIVAGQESTHMSLRPGEEVRSPLIALLFWKGDDAQRAQNLWRRWMLAHNVPRTADGCLPPPLLLGNTSGEFNEMSKSISGGWTPAGIPATAGSRPARGNPI